MKLFVPLKVSVPVPILFTVVVETPLEMLPAKVVSRFSPPTLMVSLPAKPEPPSEEVAVPLSAPMVKRVAAGIVAALEGDIVEVQGGAREIAVECAAVEIQREQRARARCR